jgi:alcohol dehydrogenase (cytochrome c)
MKGKLLIIVGALVVIAAGTAGALYYAYPVQVSIFGALATTGQKLWSQELGGAIGGGVITYTAEGSQKVAVTIGFTHPFWSTKIVTAKIQVLGLEGTSASQ